MEVFMPKPRIKLLGLTLLFVYLFMAGCSRTSLIYNFSDWFILSKIDSYFDLNSFQEKALKDALGRIMVWHRKNEIPKLVSSLEELKSRYQDGLNQDDIDWVTATHHEFWRSFFQRGTPSFAKFLTSVDAEQVRHLKLEMEKENEFMVKQMDMTEEELLDDNLDWFYGFLEDWFGDLTQGQKEKLRSWVSINREWVGIKLRSRRHFQKSFASLVNSGKGHKEMEMALMGWVEHPETIGTEEFRVQWEKRKKLWHGILLKLDATFTPAQRKRALERIQDYIDDFRDIAES